MATLTIRLPDDKHNPMIDNWLLKVHLLAIS
jgi:hypothetical protein